MGRSPSFLVSLALVTGLVAARPTRADITIFSGMDAGVGPGSPSPGTDASAAAFQTFVAGMGPSNAITFEGLPLGTPVGGQALTVAPGVELTLSNTDQSSIPNYPFGISNASPSSELAGYNTTPGGSQFLEFVPNLGGGTASLVFLFDAPIQAFGVTLTGLGNVPADVHLLFDDGTPHDITLTGAASGGIQFFGFADFGAAISKITIEERNVPAGNRDVFSLDNVLYVPVPEPSALTLLGLGLSGLLGLGLLRRRGRPAIGE